MSPTTHERNEMSKRFPRVSGDEPALSLLVDAQDEFSPRERG